MPAFNIKKNFKIGFSGVTFVKTPVNGTDFPGLENPDYLHPQDETWLDFSKRYRQEMSEEDFQKIYPETTQMYTFQT